MVEIVTTRYAQAAREELERRRRLIAQKDDAEGDFLAFVRMCWPILEPEIPLVEGWLLDLLCDVLSAVTDGELTRVCINVPPGSTKSTLLNVLWPAWEWGPCNRPSLRYMSISYSTAVPIRDNNRFTRLIKHPVYQHCWGERVKLQREGSEWVGNDRTGFKMVTSTGGGTTGFRGDRLLLDDLNNPIDVESDTVRNTTNKFIREVMPDRLNNITRSAIINLQQRTHQKDATGTLIEFGQGYEFVCVPMCFDPLRICQVVLRRDADGEPADVWMDPRALDDGHLLKGLGKNHRGEPIVKPGSPMAKAEGESCWPERFTDNDIQRLQFEKGPYAWDCNPGEAPILMADLSMRPLDEIQIGDEIVGFEVGCEPRREGEKFARRRLKRTTVLDIHSHVRPVVEVTLDSGRVIICTPNHKWYTGRTPKDATHPLYAVAKIGRALMRVCDPELPELSHAEMRMAGWLGGFYEGEGTVCIQIRREGYATNAIVSFAQGEKNLPICEELERVLTHFGFEWGMMFKHQEGNRLRMYWLKRGGLPIYQRFLHIAEPIKWRDRIVEAAYASGFIRGEERVVSIEPAGDRMVYGLTTGTGNYVAWGLACSNSQYQQIPGVRGGSIIQRDWWKLWQDEEYPALGTIIVSLDTAVEEGEKNDYTACTAWGAFAGKEGEPLFLLLEAWRDRIDLAQTVARVSATCRSRKADYLLIEHKTRGRDVSNEIATLYGTTPWETVLVKVEGGDKVARLKAVSHLFSGDVRKDPETDMWVYGGGSVYAPDKEWADEVIAEVCDFPYAKHDDWVDTVQMALKFARQNGVVLRREEWDADEYERNKFRKAPTVPYARMGART